MNFDCCFAFIIVVGFRLPISSIYQSINKRKSSLLNVKGARSYLLPSWCEIGGYHEDTPESLGYFFGGHLYERVQRMYPFKGCSQSQFLWKGYPFLSERLTNSDGRRTFFINC